MVTSALDQSIAYIPGVGPARAEMLQKELQLFTWGDLLHHYPLRHIDKTRVDTIKSLHYSMEYAQVSGVITDINVIGSGRSKRMVAQLQDATGVMELVWFQGLNWVHKSVQTGVQYLVFGKLSFFNGKAQIAHPEVEKVVPGATAVKAHLDPIYPSTEKLKARHITPKLISGWVQYVLQQLKEKDIPENIPQALLDKYKLMGRRESIYQIHFPKTLEHYRHALRRLKFEELFFAQLRMRLVRVQRKQASKGWVFDKVGDFFNAFYHQHLPFPLTNAQKRVIKEIRQDIASGKQMNRLLQGDVGSGKTIVALLCMLMAADNGYQSVLMAPTEVLAQQHYQTLRSLLQDMEVRVDLLTGSTPTKERKEILEGCATGETNILVGTHAIIEDKVVFHNLGFAVVDEQHKFGVAQRAKLWSKNTIPPHVLIMTATPIPRTLALTAYGDLDYSVMDELPPGRQHIETVHRYDYLRPKVMQFVRSEIEKGRQAYFIYPLIEESSKLDYENLMKGYEEVKSFFPQFKVSMVHGKQTPDQKESNMQKFASGDANIMVSTTVIEVGVNVPNATIMVIESAEKFGLSQLHQLRGRVGRGSEKSYCFLLTGTKLSQEAKERIGIMESTNDGFKIAEKDLELRGPGEMDGTRQSGLLQFKLANLVADKAMVETIAKELDQILTDDQNLQSEYNQCIAQYLASQKGKTAWSKIA